MSLDPIKPYLSLIKTLVVAAVLCGTFIAGCSYKAKDVHRLEDRVEQLSSANKQWADAADEATKQAEANKRFADEQYERAEELAKRLSVTQETTKATVSGLEKQLAEAKEKPECAELLKQQLCSAVPVYLGR